ncbi:hypothetical protein ACFV0T_39640 [Streptomyces sp. NPDC059582]|uniref:hypothetical protein n=1 Tax=Streptomyces sp. NPDC059582 TaxID=3346875 RepID=UPI0036C213E2
MSEIRGVPWRETARVMALCWAVCGVAYSILNVLDEPTLPIAAPVVMLLVRWFWDRHRHWAAGAAATFAGSAVVFVLTDLARPHWDRIAVDALGTAAGATVALVFFAGASRLMPPTTRSDHASHNS